MLLKDDLLWMAGQFSMTVAKSKKKETVAQMVAEYLLAHPKDVLTLIPSNELKMLREMVKLEPGNKVKCRTIEHMMPKLMKMVEEEMNGMR